MAAVLACGRRMATRTAELPEVNGRNGIYSNDDCNSVDNASSSRVLHLLCAAGMACLHSGTIVYVQRYIHNALVRWSHSHATQLLCCRSRARAQSILCGT